MLLKTAFFSISICLHQSTNPSKHFCMLLLQLCVFKNTSVYIICIYYVYDRSFQNHTVLKDQLPYYYMMFTKSSADEFEIMETVVDYVCSSTGKIFTRHDVCKCGLFLTSLTSNNFCAIFRAMCVQ